MHINFIGKYEYKKFRDDVDGCIGMNLIKLENNQEILICNITFWDAEGQFFVEVKAEEIALDLLEDFISETKKYVALY